jgi:hypothetical protein
MTIGFANLLLYKNIVASGNSQVVEFLVFICNICKIFVHYDEEQYVWWPCRQCSFNWNTIQCKLTHVFNHMRIYVNFFFRILSIWSPLAEVEWFPTYGTCVYLVVAKKMEVHFV